MTPSPCRLADITASDHHPRANGRFDLIIGSDLLYEPNHAELLPAFVNQHAEPIAKVIIVDPRRGNGPDLGGRKTCIIHLPCARSSAGQSNWLRNSPGAPFI